MYIVQRLLMISFILIVGHVMADIRLPKLFSENMVLQREKPIHIWGWANRGEKITLKFNKQEVITEASNDGKWSLYLKPEKAGGPYTLALKAKNSIIIGNILVGEIWICSGQSNMEWPVRASKDFETEKAKAVFPQIRHFELKRLASAKPQEDVKGGKWETCSPQTVGEFTAVGYFYGREIYKQMNVPIGLIHCSWPDTQIETWISGEAFQNKEDFDEMTEAIENTDFQKLPKQKFITFSEEVNSVDPNSCPSLLFNGMISPVLNFTIRGVLWYQGERNVMRAYEYRKVFPLMIQDWRSQSKQGDFPFYFVQLANFNYSEPDHQWAQLRESQAMALPLTNTGMVVAVDLGESNNIHPLNKQEVGKRLAALALNRTYRIHMVDGGPTYNSMTIRDNKIYISFTAVGSGLRVKGKSAELRGFCVAGNDQLFYPANAKVEGNQVVIYSNKVPVPVAVRYAWSDNPVEVNLFNNEGFPTCPFRTDNWRISTQNKGYKFSKWWWFD